jgi:cyclic pyranopterin phosphate synthase
MSDAIKVVDISDKDVVHRESVAEGVIRLRRSTVEALKSRSLGKGDPIATAQVAATLAVKRTSEIIPACHNVPIEHIGVSFEVGEDRVRVLCNVKSSSKTGVEMEALFGVVTALLTIWDMVKEVEKDTAGQYPEVEINSVRVVKKVKAV